KSPGYAGGEAGRRRGAHREFSNKAVKEYDDHHDARTQGDRVSQPAAQDSAGTRNTQCLELASRLCGFENWYQYLRRDLTEPLSPLDENLSDAHFTERDQFQMGV